MMVNWKFAWREVRMRPSRAILPLLIIVLGMTSIAAAESSSEAPAPAASPAGEKTANPDREKARAAQLKVAFDEDLVSQIRKLPGVRVAAPEVWSRTILYVDKTNYRVFAVGIDTTPDRKMPGFDITSGDLTDKKGGILLDDAFAASAGVKLNQKVELYSFRNTVSTHVVGFYEWNVAPSNDNVPVLIMPLVPAQHYFLLPSKVDHAQVVLKPGADKETIRTAIQKILPTDIEVRDMDGGFRIQKRRPAPDAANQK
jgi:ABC-type lipoprotein release transport system permease subunit